jgi:hypothetical protein
VSILAGKGGRINRSRAAYAPTGRWPKRERQDANVNVLNDGRKAGFGGSTSVYGVEVLARADLTGPTGRCQ